MEESLRPEDDYYSWCLLFLDGIHSEGEFKYLINGYCRLVDQWNQTGQLPDGLVDETNNFIEDFVPRAVRLVTGLYYVPQDDQEACLTFLEKTVEIIPYAIVRNNGQLLAQLGCVLHSGCEFYVRNGVECAFSYPNAGGKYSKFYKAVIQHCVDFGILDIAAQECIKPGHSLPLSVFDWLFWTAVE